MRSTHVRSVLLAPAALALASAPAAAQDLGLVEGLFEEVSAVTVFYQFGGVPGSDEVSSDGLLNGAGTEVLINLAQAGDTEFELGLGASYLQDYRAVEPSLDLRTSLRALPTISLYASRPLAGALDAFLGGSFGLVELWNGQAYDPSGNTWDVEARTFEVGASAGLYLDIGALPGVFGEAGWRVRRFPSVKWTPRGEEALPPEWPRSLDFSGWFLSLGLQLRLDRGGAEDREAGITPPAPAGSWLLERVDGAPVPALLDSSRTGMREVVHGVLRLRADTLAADGAEGRGTWSLEMNVRERGGLVVAGQPDVRVSQVAESGTYATDGEVLRLTAPGGPGQVRRLERLAGRLYLQWNGHVLAFAPGSMP
ncbi:MAG: hypothetical protein KY467_09810 [Gemmatimonadetes bacterium]|nr:hypothetical protein [Gemmatimonadota bacterium]